MERGKIPSTRGKGKAQHFPSDLYVLGSKTSSDASKRSLPSGSGERKRENSSLPLVGGKKSKPMAGAPTPLGRPGTSSPVTAGVDPWEAQALEVEASEVVDTVLEAHQAAQHDKTAGVICGCLKTLKYSKWKPDSVITVGLIYLAKLKPSLFSTEHVTQALSALLKRDPQHNFKSKGNPTVAVMAANLLARGYNDIKHWPATFIKLYIEDAMGERVWVDQPECKGFVSNLLTGFGTKLPPQNINFLVPEMGPVSGMARADSPLTISLDDDEDGNSSTSVLDTPAVPRFAKCTDMIEQIVLDMQANRRQTPESITRNYLKLLASAAGIVDVRVFASSRLEMWLQNPKLMKPAQELLLYVCCNCSTHSQKDIQVIGSVVKIRLKTKALINFYLSCIRELISAHPENLFTLLKHTIYNELSNVRNPNNMAMIGVLFHAQAEESASLLADVFLELLLNRDDYLRSLRSLLREIVRVLRHDINLVAFCRGMMADKRDNQVFRDFELKERMFCAIVDLITNACFLGVSAAVKDAVNLVARGDKREIQTVIHFHTMIATIQQETVLWLKDSAIKVYRPSAIEFGHALHKVVFMEQQETYYKVDMWPPESERSFMFRMVAECPLYETTLFTILVIGLSKEHPISGPDSLELADQLVKRTASLAAYDVPMLSVSRTDLLDVVLKVTAYHHPDNISLPPGYSPPKLAIGNSYWKAWILLLTVCAHNPATLGTFAWEKFPTLRMFMEMCITNHFSYPPPTMQIPESNDESKLQEARQTQLERDQILEFEKHLAAASTKATITEATSLLLPQLITMDIHGLARKPPTAVLEQLAALNTTHRLGHLLCRSRHPDFLLDLIQRQGASQSMPWLADLVENSESSLSHLPLQCLCEFLLTSGPIEQQSKGQQLVAHLQQVVTSSEQDALTPCEVMEYLLRRLSSHIMSSRVQAIKGLKLVLGSGSERENLPGYLQENAWLLTQLPKLPHFKSMRPQVVSALRQACQVENEPTCIASYIQFLAVHAANDDLSCMGLLVQDMAQLIVERSTIMNAIVPDGTTNDSLRNNTLHSLMLIFYSYLNMLRQPRGENYQWTDSPDQVLVTWATGEEATLYILVVHAMIILLSHGIGSDEKLYERMLNIWFPLVGEQPRAYLVDTSEEALLIPDWLKLRMIRSGVPRLVDAALIDLAPQQLVLFIQSFGIPISSMSRLLETLDCIESGLLLATNFDKSYMTQLVQVQQRRGATGGQRFLQNFGQREEGVHPQAFKETIPMRKLIIRPSSLKSTSTTSKFHLPKVSMLFSEIFSLQVSQQDRARSLDHLHKILIVDAKPEEKIEGATIILQHLLTILHNEDSFSGHLQMLQQDPVTCSLAIRLIFMQFSALPQRFQAEFILYAKHVSREISTNDTALLVLLRQISKSTPKVDLMDTGEVSNCGKRFSAMLDAARENIGKVIDQLVATEPELIGTGNENEVRMLLFGKPVKNETAGGVMEECRPYLLTLLTHRASWSRLHTLVHHLLSRFEIFYSPTAVLDFLEAMTRNPRLWQGREKHVPKHSSHEPVLVLNQNQVMCLVEYIISEAELSVKSENLEEVSLTNSDESRPEFLDILETRLPLLLESLNETISPRVVKSIAVTLGGLTGTRETICKHLLLLVYLRVPGLIQHLYGTEQEELLKSASIQGWSCSTLDKLSHTLLTAMMSYLPEHKDGSKKSHEYELSARKMTVVHPALVLRQLPMLAASLQGRVHLDYHVLKTRNHITVFTQVLGLMELLQPLIFSDSHRPCFHLLLDSYLTLYKLHGQMKDVIHTVAKFVAFLQKYIIHDTTSATKYLQANSQTLAAIQKRLPNLASLQAVLSGVLTVREEGDDLDVPQPWVDVTAPSDLLQTPPPHILNALHRCNIEDLQPALQDLDHLSSRNPAILEVVSEPISELLMSPYGNIRSLALTLLSRLLKHNPQCKALAGYLRCLESGQGDIVESALEKLPEIAISAQEHAVQLLGKAFSMAMQSNLTASTHISKAIAMLNQQNGC